MHIRGRPSPAFRQRGFTLVEIAFGIFVAGGLIYVGYQIFVALRSSRRVITGTFTQTTTPISIQEGGTGTFVFTMSQTVGGGTAASIPNRRITLTVQPAAAVTITSVTNGVGDVLTVNAATTTVGQTDANGNVTVVITARAIGPASLVAKDETSGQSETTNFDVVP